MIFFSKEILRKRSYFYVPPVRPLTICLSTNEMTRKRSRTGYIADE